MEVERVLFLTLALSGISLLLPWKTGPLPARSGRRESFRNRIIRDIMNPVETEDRSGEVPPVSSVSFYIKLFAHKRSGTLLFMSRDLYLYHL